MIRVAIAMLVLSLSAPAAARPSGTWGLVRAPAKGDAEAIGGYSKGCVRGAVALPKRGPNHRVVHPKRHRHFGHPLLIDFVSDLARVMSKKRLGRLSVGDLSQPRGGPAPSGHASHQSGLDADLWFLPGRALSVVDHRRSKPSRHWSSRVRRVLELSASDERVARIFVHPVIKRTLCKQKHRSRAWLRKLRPWWGHDSHFHVRLHCPATSTDCEPQSEIAAGDGCAEVEWWFSEEARANRAEQRKKYQKKVGAAPELPAKCSALARP